MLTLKDLEEAINQRVPIKCTTDKQLELVLDVFRKAGFRWKSGTSLDHTGTLFETMRENLVDGVVACFYLRADNGLVTWSVHSAEYYGP